MRLDVKTIGDIARIMAAENAASGVAVTRGIKASGEGLMGDWRGQVERAGLGSRLAKTVRAQIYPKRGTSQSAATYVWSRAPRIIDAFERGATIRSDKGFYLAIPTEEAGVRGVGRARVTPRGWEQRTGITLRFVFRTSQYSLLVADDARINTRGRAVMNRRKRRRDGILTGAMTVPIFILVPQVRLRKRLDVAGAADRWSRRAPDLIVANWPRTR